ncbi:MAG TPA: tetratricopeptide repeat protein [Jatrophihabitantaceae bacterium]
MNCTQPGCTGQIEDGYCNVCGSPASTPVGRASSAYQGASPSGATPSTRTSSSSRLTSEPIGSARAGGTRPTRRLGTTRTRSQRLGAGITSVPAAPVPDPRSEILANPEVSEDKRFCARCGSPVGRSREGKPGRSHGFCPKCRTEFSFAPKLVAGELVGGQYEVTGALAHGGLGWIYLAADKNVSDRWVVLKGLLNTGDLDAYQAAVAERQFLAEVQHPLIVNIYNFAMHENAGYTVMEYVGGSSLKQLLKSRLTANQGRYDPFPADQAIAYMVEILPAFSYLHSQGLLYCDFKPDNIIQAGDAVKLIDLGGVRRMSDNQSAIYGTIGFQAPEVATLGPSVASDIYTVGRTLAVLMMEFRGYQSTYVKSLPPVDDTALFQRYDSLYRVLAKATAENPNDRFQSADELHDQLLAVLREVVASDGPAGPARQSTPSVLFGAPAASGSTLEWDELPPLLVDTADPAAAWLGSVSIEDPVQRLAALDGAPHDTVEVRLARARAAIEAGQFDLAAATIEQILGDDPWEWRAVWLSGLAALARSDSIGATAAFNTVLGQVPGELAPKLALGLACEVAGERQLAQGLYRTCTIVDANYVAPAAFGLARTALADGDVDGALTALELVGPTSGAYVTARRTRAEVLADSDKGLPALADAAATVEKVPIDPRERQQLVVKVLTQALEHVRQTGRPEPQTRIAGVPATERDLRTGAEQAYRQLASLTPDRLERVRLVDAANAVRPRSLV